MPATFSRLTCLLAAVSLSALAGATGAQAKAGAPAEPQIGAQTAAAQAGLSDDDQEDDVVVTGQRERGAVIGNIKPEQQFNSGDIRALGISSVNDLLTELGPEFESASGQPPVVLLEGHRISSFREIRSLPAEAIARVDVLPGEVGLRYGYGADQKVINIVLRKRFHALTAETGGKVSTDGGGGEYTSKGGFLSIHDGRRVNISRETDSTARLFESQRGLTAPDSAARTLAPAEQSVDLNGSYHRPLDARTLATLNVELTSDQSEGNQGLALQPFNIPGTSPYADNAATTTITPVNPDIPALQKYTSAQGVHLGLSVNAERSTGQWTLTGTYDHNESRTLSSRPFDLSAFAAAVTAGDPDADPTLPIPDQFLAIPPADQARSRSDAGEVDLIYNRTLARLPTGDLSATFKLSGAATHVDNQSIRNLAVTNSQLERNSGDGSLNLTVPLSSSSVPLADWIGSLSLDGHASFGQYSDAGSVHGYGMGLHWSPIQAISFTASFDHDQSVPTIAQLGDPAISTQSVPVFDYVNGESVLVTTLSGGNPGLANAEVRKYRLGLTVTPLKDPRLVLSFGLNHSVTDGEAVTLPGITAATQAAFPSRFTRDVDGTLTQLDLRPVNIDSQSSTVFRWGFSFTKSLKTPQKEVEALRAAFRKRYPNGVPGRNRQRQSSQEEAHQDGQGSATSSTPNATSPQSSGQQPGGGSTAQPGSSGTQPAQSAQAQPAGRGSGRFGRHGMRGGRLNFALYHSWTLTNTARIAAGQPEIDLLNGGTLGSNTAPSRHKIEMRAGYSQNGIGVRLSGNWQNASHVEGAAGMPDSNLRFSSLATLDARVFVNLTQIPVILEKVPLLRGSRVFLSVKNVFNSRQHVTDGNGNTPYAYQSAFLDPLGRTVQLTFRKLIF